MNLTETHDLLTLIAVYDNRRFDDATVLAWREVLGDCAFGDCRTAVVRHFSSSTAYLLPAHVRANVLDIRRERSENHPIRELPSRFEADAERAERVRRGVAACAEALSLANQRRHVADEPVELDYRETIRQRAIERARRERKGRAA